MNTGYRMCTKCVMDTTDPDIEFDDCGVCNHCRTYDWLVSNRVLTGSAGLQKVRTMVDTIKKEGVHKDYDCIIGVSGGVDSSFVAYKVKELGLRPLAVHVDNGWDSNVALENIENLLKHLDIDLFTYTLDWEEFKDLQLAFLRGSTPDLEIPTDHAIRAVMYRMAVRLGVKYIISGCNVRTESHLPRAWSQGHSDWKYIKSVHKLFGKRKLKTFPHRSMLTKYRYEHSLKWVDILNYLDYVKKHVKEILVRGFHWKDYGGKHFESIYTRFCQGYILPRKFSFDKRKAHLSSLICSGEISRQQALDELHDETYPVELQQADKRYVINKLSLTDREFEVIMNAPKKTYWDYASYGKFYQSAVFRGARAIYRITKRLCLTFSKPKGS